VINPPRSLSLFLNRLSEINDFRLSVAILATPPLRWATATAQALGSSFTLKQADISDLVIDEKVLARVSLGSQEDVRSALNTLTSGKHHKLEKLHMDLLTETQGHMKLTLSSDGVLRCHDSTPAETIEAVRSSLPKPR
jgi:hypothetical protein